MECEGGDRPCGACAPCRKVLRGIHPDVAVVEDPEHRNVAVEVLRRAAADAYILPNEGRRKVYIFPDCSLLDGKAQNVLLKVVEDGPVHAAFLFCAANSAVLLPTIRSRTAEWKLSPPPETAAEDGQARRLCELICGGRAPEGLRVTQDGALRALLSQKDRELLAAEHPQGEQLSLFAPPKNQLTREDVIQCLTGQI